MEDLLNLTSLLIINLDDLGLVHHNIKHLTPIACLRNMHLIALRLSFAIVNMSIYRTPKNP